MTLVKLSLAGYSPSPPNVSIFATNKQYCVTPWAAPASASFRVKQLKFSAKGSEMSSPRAKSTCGGVRSSRDAINKLRKISLGSRMLQVSIAIN